MQTRKTPPGRHARHVANKERKAPQVLRLNMANRRAHAYRHDISIGGGASNFGNGPAEVWLRLGDSVMAARSQFVTTSLLKTRLDDIALILMICSAFCILASFRRIRNNTKG